MSETITETTGPAKVDTTQWQAFLSDENGFVHEDPDEALREIFDDELDGRITICRGTALPNHRHGDLRMEGTYTSSDIFLEIDFSDIDEYEEAVETWRRAQQVAWGMNQPADAVEKLTRERDSLARRCAVRFGETEQARAELKLYQQRHDLALREIREVVNSDGPIEVRDVEAIREALEMEGCTACPPGCPSCTVDPECGCDVHPEAAESSADPVEATHG